MTARKQYYKLDEVGFVGVQKKKRTSTEIQKEIGETTKYIKALKSAGK